MRVVVATAVAMVFVVRFVLLPLIVVVVMMPRGALFVLPGAAVHA
jgi:hypothetical protein